jgi:cation transport regulator ChaC
MILSNSGKFSLLLFSSFSTILSVVCLITAAPLTQFNHLRDSLRLNMVIQDGTEEALGTAGPQWDPIQQIYIGGVVPENAEVQTLIHTKGQWLLAPFRIWLALLESRDRSTFRIWRREQFGSCSGIQAMLGPKKSTDHRGWPAFPGIVCTLLEDEEVAAIHNLPEGVTHSPPAEPTMTEGVIYLIPPDLVPECLEELDFREKGGYARDIIEVVEDDTGETHQSLLYRGTPDNPAFWPRAMLDLPLAAAIMSVSEGPSGSNVVYLNSLDQFLSDTHSIAAENDDTTSLATMARFFQKNHIFISCLGLEAINTINYFWIDQNMRPC